ncbi:hypothetical protein [Flavobacterium fluviatile]|uniref:hypothetical protein n=1 Tax=Flavobacterium fluviatile TaxID=1862387 RepID=UPI0013D723A2|nr:hypothetical protein [Flavobacterium fluviatile]
MEHLKSNSKEQLIQLALEILKNQQPSVIINPDDFEATAWGNSKEILVKFRRYIRFIPLNAEPFQYYDITVNLITNQILPFESGYNFTFNTPTEADKKKLDFIKSKTDFPKESNAEITITENEDHYWISKKSKTSFSKFFINKETGFKSGVMEGSFSAPAARPVLESVYEKEEMVKLSDENEINRITKNAVIRIAKGIIEEKQPLLKLNFDDYETIVWVDSKNTWVEFKRVIRYIPLGTDPEKRFSYDITVNLNNDGISPFDDTFESEFYIETKEDKKAIEFIKKNFGSFSANFENTVYEGEENYYIDINNQYSFGKYAVNKKTGIAKTEIQGSYEPMPKPVIENPDDYTEIK